MVVRAVTQFSYVTGFLIRSLGHDSCKAICKHLLVMSTYKVISPSVISTHCIR